MSDRISEESKKMLEHRVANVFLNSELDNMFQHDILPPVNRTAKQLFFQLKNKLKTVDSYQYSTKLSKTSLGVNLSDLEKRINMTRNKFQQYIDKKQEDYIRETHSRLGRLENYLFDNVKERENLDSIVDQYN